jgi:ribosomal protein S14
MHCYTRFTQVKNRCIMGGKGRGVFSDFRLGRVCDTRLRARSDANQVIVPIPNQRARWISTGCEEGKLVTRRHDDGGCGMCVYYGEKIAGHWAALIVWHVSGIEQDNLASTATFVDQRSFHLSLLSPLANCCRSKRRSLTAKLQIAHPASTFLLQTSFTTCNTPESRKIGF